MVIGICVILVTSTLLIFIFGLIPDEVPNCIFQQCNTIHNVFSNLINEILPEILDSLAIFRNQIFSLV